MEFGIHIGTRGCLTTRDNMMAVAINAEAAGYGILGVVRSPDHAGPDRRFVTPTPPIGKHPAAREGECFDAIATLAFLAGCTQRIKLLTSVAVVPHRPAVLTAKLFLTADVLSGGRVIAGVGAGWMKEEFDALGTPPFEERGAVTDEYIRAWMNSGPRTGRRCMANTPQFDNVVFEPKPVSKPHPPIWVGGESGRVAAPRRAASATPGIRSRTTRNPVQHAGPAEGRHRHGMHRAAEKAGRDPGLDRYRLYLVRAADWKPQRR